MKSNIGIGKREKRAVRAEFDKHVQDTVRRVIKVVCASLNEEYGFGKIRCSRLIRRVTSNVSEHATDEIFWYHVDAAVIDRMGIDFDREDYEALDR